MSDDTTPNRADDLSPDAAPTSAVALLPNSTELPPDGRQQRVLSIAKALDSAYQKASTLELSDAEIARLRSDFPDDAVRAGANGKPGLLYLEHAHVRERLHDVFGPGRWALVMRRMWSEDYVTGKGSSAVRVYAECVLLVRGCYVGESIGAMSYFPNNAEQNYSDAVEGAQSEALRRIAGKYLGIGLQVWHKSFCEAWKRRHPTGFVPPPDLAEPEQDATLTDEEAEAAFAIVAERVGDAAGKVTQADQEKFLGLVSKICQQPVSHLSEVPQRFLPRVLDTARRLSVRPGSQAAARKENGK